MRRRLCAASVLLGLAGAGVRMTAESAEPKEIRFMTLDPGHFHAALVLREAQAGVAKKVDVYAPLGPDLLDHLTRITRFNTRKSSPTAWEVEAHTGPDFLERMLKERPGNAVVLSGKNRGKIDRLQASLDGGIHALVDKPWILDAADMPKLERALATAETKGLVAYDIMTERYEVSSELQRELVNDRAVFGTQLPGSPAEPAVYMESVHHLKKVVDGVPNMRPAWFFDAALQGEGINDIGTHLVDLVQWTLHPDQAIDYKKDAKVLAAQRWATAIPEAEFRSVTGVAFPPELAASVKDGVLQYFCNGLVSYTLRGVHVGLNVIWDWEPPAGAGDTHFAFYKGSRARIEVRQGKAERYRTELYVVPVSPADKSALLTAVNATLERVRARYPGTSAVDAGAEIRIQVPDALRISHEEHFGQVAQRFLQYVRDRKTLPAWERPNMLAKYFVTTEGMTLARRGEPRVAERRAPR